MAGILPPAVPIRALVAAAGQLGSGYVQLFDHRMLGVPTPYQKANAWGENSVSKTSKVSNRIPTIMLDGIPRHRTESQSSLSSIGSAESIVLWMSLKDIVLWIERVELDHEEIIKKETAYQQMLQTAEADRQERLPGSNYDQPHPPERKNQPQENS